MSNPSDGTKLDRRTVIKGVALAGAAALAPPMRAEAQVAAVPDPAGRAQPVPAAAPAGAAGWQITQTTGGGDYMVDVFKSLGFEFLAANPGTSFRGLHEAVINYGMNSAPEFITCTHEELSVGIAHGYSKVEGKPILCAAHGTVGLQHASMALYNAWCDHVPVYLLLGNTVDGAKRAPGADWAHSAQDPAAMVRDFTKWDDQPGSLTLFGESAVRAYEYAMTAPSEPVVLVLDSELQENPLPGGVKPPIPRLPRIAQPQGDTGAVAEAAKLLVNAEKPVIIADRCARSQAGIDRLIELAEALQAPVVDLGGRMNFPTRHPLNLSNKGRPLINQADVILGLEVSDFWGATHAFHDRIEDVSNPTTRPGAKLIHVSARTFYMKANYQDFQRYAEVDLLINGEAEATLPMLIDAVRGLIDGNRKSVLAARGAKLAAASAAALRQTRLDASYGWTASPVSTARMCAEIYEVLRGEDYTLGSVTTPWVDGWPSRLWDLSQLHQYTGHSGGYGIGYCAPAAVGAGLANRKRGRITVSIQPDGDLMYSPGILWTAAHHQVPILFVMHNNRAYHQEIMGIQKLANRHQRGIDRTHIGVTLTDPFIDYATVAKGFGVYSEGPISNPADLGAALRRAIAVVKRGEPALVDVVTQPR